MSWRGEVEDGVGWGGLVPTKAERGMKVNNTLYGRAELDAAVAAERERCAKVCEAAWEIDGSKTAAEFAARVRGA